MMGFIQADDTYMNTLQRKNKQLHPFPVQFSKLTTYTKRQRAQILQALLEQEPDRQQELTGLFNGLRWLSYRDQLIERFVEGERDLTMLPSTIVEEHSAQYEHLTALLAYRTNLECPEEIYNAPIYNDLSPRAYMFFLSSMIVACLQAEQRPSELFTLTFQRLCTLDDFHIERYAYCFDRTLINQFLKLYCQNPYFESYHHIIRYSLAKYWD